MGKGAVEERARECEGRAKYGRAEGEVWARGGRSMGEGRAKYGRAEGEVWARGGRSMGEGRLNQRLRTVINLFHDIRPTFETWYVACECSTVLFCFYALLRGLQVNVLLVEYSYYKHCSNDSVQIKRAFQASLVQHVWSIFLISLECTTARRSN